MRTINLLGLLAVVASFACTPTPLLTSATPAPDAGTIALDTGTILRDSGSVDPDAGFLRDARPPPIDCTNIPELPLQFQTVRGPISGEDFAFDREGHLVSTDEEGNLVKSTIDGTKRVFVPNVGSEIAGMRFLPGGDLVLARVDTGTLERVAASGGTQTILSGLDYPNGIEIGIDGFVYVTEQSAGRVRRVDPDSGAYSILVENIDNPNGLSFSPDYRTLYIGSFGSGTVHALPIDAEGQPGDLSVLAATPDASNLPTEQELIDACVGKSEYDSCSIRYYVDLEWPTICFDELGYGVQACVPDWPDLVTPCANKRVGDACSLDWLEQTYSGTCEDFDNYSYCESPDLWSGLVPNGGLDGMGVDACGFVYVTEFGVGTVWRISPDGSQVEQVFNPETQWVPNMQWGSGIGGWDENTLYVIDREPDLLYAIPLGIPSKQRVYP